MDAPEIPVSIGPVAFQRRHHNQLTLQKAGLSIDGIPNMFYAEEVLELRAISKIARRFVALVIVAARGEGLVQERAFSLVDKYELRRHLSPKELAFLEEPEPTLQQNLVFHWQQEAAMVMGWAGGWLPEMPTPNKLSIGQSAGSVVARQHDMDDLRDQANRRSLKDLLDRADFYFQLHHILRIDYHGEKALQKRFSYPAVYQRHCALSWLIGWYGRDWDELDIPF